MGQALKISEIWLPLKTRAILEANRKQASRLSKTPKDDQVG